MDSYHIKFSIFRPKYCRQKGTKFVCQDSNPRSQDYESGFQPLCYRHWSALGRACLLKTRLEWVGSCLAFKYQTRAKVTEEVLIELFSGWQFSPSLKHLLVCTKFQNLLLRHWRCSKNKLECLSIATIFSLLYWFCSPLNWL